MLTARVYEAVKSDIEYTRDKTIQYIRAKEMIIEYIKKHGSANKSTVQELCELTGLTESELWEKGFILDDWDIGFQSDIKLHRTSTADDIQDGYEEDELIDDYDLPAHWLMMQMNNFCVGANYVFFNGKHYYTVHHS